MNPFDGIEAHWLWATLGLLLAATEMLVPGVYLMWLAGAALITALITFVAAPSIAVQIVSFAFLALILVFSARRFLHESPPAAADPLLNQPGVRLIGQSGKVSEAIVNGVGRVHLGDSEWLARGPDLPAGTPVRVQAVVGTVLVVEPLALPSATPGDDGLAAG